MVHFSDKKSIYFGYKTFRFNSLVQLSVLRWRKDSNYMNLLALCLETGLMQ